MLKGLAPHVCWAALLEIMTGQRRRHLDAHAPEAQAAVTAFTRLLKAERGSLDRVDVTKVRAWGLR